MNTFKNVRAIEFTAQFDGFGCVNFDSKEQSFFLNSVGLGNSVTRNNNVKYAKKLFQNVIGKDSNNKDEVRTHFKYKVSSDAIMRGMYEKDIPFQNPSIANVPYVLYKISAMPCYISKGYTWIIKDKKTLKRKSCVCVCDAIENNEWRKCIPFDFHARSGEKDMSVKDENDSKDTTIFNVENVGNNTYTANGFIDLTELQFISADPLYDRMAIDVDGGENEKIYMDSLKRNLPSFNGDFDYYYINGSCVADEWAERGLLLDTESVDFLVKDILKRIMNVDIIRRSARFKFKSIQITILMEGGQKETINLTQENLNDLFFECYYKYSLANADKIRANKELVEQVKKEQKEANKKANKEKKVNKKDKQNNEE